MMDTIVCALFLCNICLCAVSFAAAKTVEQTDIEVPAATGVNKILNDPKENVKLIQMVNHLLQRTSEIEKHVHILENENVMLKNQINNFMLTAEMLKLELKKQANVAINNNNLQPEISRENVHHQFSNDSSAIIDSEVKSRTKRAVGNVAFTAYLSQTTILQPGQAIKFDKVILNDGHAYNEYTGAFTAPLTGVYLFTFNFDSRRNTFVRLVINGVNTVDAVANPHVNPSNTRLEQSMGGNSAILHVNHGEAVLIEVFETANAEAASSETFRLCTFTGVLLY